MGSKTWACRIIKLKRIIEKTKTDMNLNIFFSLGIKKEKIFKFISVFVFSIILFNFIIRQAQVFDPILSWHFYHVMIAIWLYLITIMLTKKIAIYV